MKRRTKIVLVVLGILTAGLVFFVLAIPYIMFSSLVEISVPSREDIQRMTRLEFSDAVTIIGAQHISSLDTSLYIALEVPYSEVEKIFPEEKYNPSTKQRYLFNDSEDGRKWFTPDSIKNFKSFRYSNDIENYGMHVLYDASEIDMVKVYISWFGNG